MAPLLVNGEPYQALLQVDGESCAVQVGFLLICGKSVELPHVVKYTWFPCSRYKNSFSLVQSRPTDRWCARKAVRNSPHGTW
jgi:hypothetical protein